MHLTSHLPDHIKSQLSRAGPAHTIWLEPVVNIERDNDIFSHEAVVRGPNGEATAHVISQIPQSKRLEFEATCRHLALQLAGTLNIPARLSLNFSSEAICDNRFGFAETIRATQVSGFTKQRLIFEVSGGRQLADIARARRHFELCRGLQIQIALDSVFADYNGLDKAVDHPPDIVKLDSALIRGLDADVRRQSAVCTIVSMCQHLHILPIAEDVETYREMKTLRAMGVTHMQGVFFHRSRCLGSDIVFRYPVISGSDSIKNAL